MSKPDIKVHAVYGYKVVSQAKSACKWEFDGGGWPASTYSDSGATAIILAWTYGGAVIGWIAGEVLLAVAKGALQ